MMRTTQRAVALAISLAAIPALASSAFAQAPTQRRAAQTPAKPAQQPPAPAPAPAATAPALPEPPIPAQHALQAGIPQCVPALTQVGHAALGTEYNAQSLWNQANPAQHIFQSVAGLENPKNVPPSGMVAIIAAPLQAQKCDVVAVEVYPLASTCTDIEKLMAKGGEVETSLQAIKVLTDAQKRRLFLMPGFGNTCIAVSVNSFFGN